SASQRRQTRTLIPESSRCPIRVAFPQDLHTTMTFERSMNCSFRMMPPVWPPRDVGRMGRWRLARATPSTMTRFSRGRTLTTRPRLPRSLPAITSTSSFFLISTVRISLVSCQSSQHLGSQRDDLHESLLPELSRHRTEDPGAPWVLLFVDQYNSVVVELDVRTVRPTAFLGRSHDDSLHHLALLHPTAGERVLHRTHDDVAHAGVSAPRAAQHPDHQDLFGPRVVRHSAPALRLDHLAFSTTSTTRHRLVFESGRVSMIRTVSPSAAPNDSSCALSLVERRTILPYSGWRTWLEMRTTTVFAMPSDTTTPVRTLRWVRS